VQIIKTLIIHVPAALVISFLLGTQHLILKHPQSTSMFFMTQKTLKFTDAFLFCNISDVSTVSGDIYYVNILKSVLSQA
jgi:hypothetical protein